MKIEICKDICRVLTKRLHETPIETLSFAKKGLPVNDIGRLMQIDLMSLGIVDRVNACAQKEFNTMLDHVGIHLDSDARIREVQVIWLLTQILWAWIDCEEDWVARRFAEARQKEGVKE